MTRLVLPLSSLARPIFGGGFLLRMRAWLAAVQPACGEHTREPEVAARPVADNGTVQSAILLPFPIRGEALLVKLADTLRGRIADREPRHNPFLLAISRGPRSQLLIDQAAYIEFHTDRASYHMVVEAASDATVTLDTTDFDTLVQFVVQYINGRLSEPTALEVAS